MLAAGTFVNAATFLDLGKELLSLESQRGFPFGSEIVISSISGGGTVVGGSVNYPTFDRDCANLACGQRAFSWSIINDHSIAIPSLEPAHERSWRREPLSVAAFSFNGDTAVVAFDQNDG